MIETKLVESEINGQKVYKTYCDIALLRPDPNNPKDITDENHENLCKYLEQDGQLLPLLVDARPEKEGVIIGGNHTLECLKEIGKTEAWIEFRSPTSDAHAFSLALRHNQQFAIYLEDKLEEELKKHEGELGDELKRLEVQLQEATRINELIDQASGDIQEDEPPAVNDEEPAVSQLGELYKLGRHYLLCGDSTKIEDVEKLMGGVLE